MAEVDDYIDARKERTAREFRGVRDPRVFDLNYIPEKPLFRSEAKQIIDCLVSYKVTGLPRNMIVVGSRGCGKTLMMHHLTQAVAQKLGLRFHIVNCRTCNTSFKVLAHILRVRARGYAFGELCAEFERRVAHPAVIVLDEADLMAEKELRNDILYFLSRSPQRYSVIVLSNNPRFISSIDPSARSSLQPELLHFKNYTADEILRILQDRAAVGLGTLTPGILEEIAAMTARNTNSDVRVALKTLLYVALGEAGSVAECFERAQRDLVLDMINGLNDKALLILKAACEEASGLVKPVYERYVRLSRQKGEEPYSYVYFYSSLAYLQSVNLAVLISAKVNRAYTNRIQPLVTPDLLDPVVAGRFQV